MMGSGSRRGQWVWLLVAFASGVATQLLRPQDAQAQAAQEKSDAPAGQQQEKPELVAKPPPVMAADKQAAAPAPAQEGPVQQLAPLSSRDVVERLKTLRSEIVLEEEQARLLKARLERLELEREVAMAEARASRPIETKPGVKEEAPILPSRTIATPRFREAPVVEQEPDILVKAITVRPFKEAIVMYRGRVYTVRPGDKLGAVEIKDINESGVVTSNGRGGGQSVLLGR